MNISMKEVRAAYPPEKQKSDPLWAKIIIRQLSFYLAWLALRLNISAFSVSVASLLLPLIAVYFWLIPRPVVAIVLLMVWFLLDCVDGNVARANGGTKMGAFVDASSGYMMLGFSFFGLGAYLDILHPDMFSNHFAGFTMMGASVSILNLLARIYYQKYINVLGENSSGTDSAIENPESIIKIIDKNIGVGGFFTPLLLIAYYSELLIPLLVFYTVYTLFYFIGISWILMLRSTK